MRVRSENEVIAVAKQPQSVSVKNVPVEPIGLGTYDEYYEELRALSSSLVV